MKQKSLRTLLLMSIIFTSNFSIYAIDSETKILDDAIEKVSELTVSLSSHSFHNQSGYYRVDSDVYTSFEQLIESKISDINIIYDPDKNNGDTNDQEYITNLSSNDDVLYKIDVLNDDWGKRNNGEYSFTITRTEGEHSIVSNPLTLNIIFSKFEAIVGRNITNNKELYNVDETIDLNEFIYSIVAREDDGIDDNKQIKIMYDGKTTDGTSSVMQNFPSIEDFNYIFTVHLMSDDWGETGNYLFEIRNNDLLMEVELPLTFGRPILVAHEMGTSTIYAQDLNDFNNPEYAKELFSTILANQEDEDNKITLKFGIDKKSSDLVTAQDFLDDRTYSVTMTPIENPLNTEYQFVISKDTPAETLTTTIRANIEII
ncbi:hypothetical protein AN641_09405 [Candidatus Epulonipiscioides gigas]|nr:hypothetical protein AN641_09405 [Epulopiscium sp. SCG-C07WGA-EpuloA2]